jgi:uncharacterized membrane protein
MNQRLTKPHFSAELVPHNSLSPTGFVIVMGIIAGVSFVTGLFFFLLGAWPVIGFLGLDVAVMYWAFKRSFRDGEQREIVEVDDHNLVVTRLAPGKPTQTFTFQRRWVRIELELDEERELVGPLRLFERGRAYEIAGFLGPDDKVDFWRALKAAIAIKNI